MIDQASRIGTITGQPVACDDAHPYNLCLLIIYTRVSYASLAYLIYLKRNGQFRPFGLNSIHRNKHGVDHFQGITGRTEASRRYSYTSDGQADLVRTRRKLGTPIKKVFDNVGGSK